MPVVTLDVRTYMGASFPANERLVVRFVPTAASVGSSVGVYPLREVKVEVPSDGQVSVNLVRTISLSPPTGYKVRFEWFDRHPVKNDWTLRGWSELDGVLHVPTEGGAVNDLLGDYAIGAVIVFLGFGPPPAWLPTGGVYYNLSSSEGVDIYSDGVAV